MAFNRPTLTQIISRILTDIESRLQTGKLLAQSFLAILGTAFAGAAHGLHGHVEWAARQLFPDTADEEYAKRWATIWGVSLKPADYAEGPAVFVGLSGITIPAGSVLQISNGKQYSTNVDAVIVSETATVAVTALDAGNAGNLPAGTTLSLISPIAGVETNAVVGAGGLVNGVDVESVDSLRARTLARIQEPPHGGAAYDYKAWALEVSGITRAYVYPLQYGIGTVGIAVLADNSIPIFPDSIKLGEVQAHIDAVNPVTAEPVVWTPTALPVNFTIHLSPDTAAIRTAVEASLKDMLYREAEPGKTILLSKIREAVSVAAGENDNTVSVPAANVTVTATQMATFGAITWI